MKINNRYLIKTDSGYQKFDGLKETISNGLIIEFDKTIIRCTNNHRMMVNNDTKNKIWVQADQLIVGDSVSSFLITKITKDTKSTYYDPINVQGDNTYLAKDITHHNCAITVVDETAFIRSNMWEDFSDSIFPAQSGLAWKKNILISTANGMNHFYEIIKGARDDSNGYIPFEVNWKDVPRFRPDGTKMPSEEFQNNIVKKYGIVYFNQNYANEFLGSSYTLISGEKLKQMKSGEIEEKRDNKLKIYKYPEENHQYIMTVDAAKDGNDAFAVQIVDITDFRFEQVAVAKLQIDYLLMPEFLNEWCELYNMPYLIIENNEGAGQSVADQMYQTYEYENLHFDKTAGGKKKKYPGFRTTVKSRKQIIQTLKLFIENNKLIINNKDTIDEFFQFILIKNKYQADDGAHDDMIMSLAMTFVPFVDTKNFEDMSLLIQALYSDELDYKDKDDGTSFAQMMTIGSFDDGTDEEHYNEADELYDNEGFQ
jgi:hypothetical protein